MKIWIDFLTPKQCLFFEPLIKKLEKNHQLLCTTRNYREAKELAKIRKINAIVVGKHGGSDRAEKLIAAIDRMKSLFKIIKKFNPDLVLSMNSPDAARMAFGFGIKHIAFSNSPHAEKQMKLILPLVNTLLTPKHIPKKEYTQYGISTKNIIQYKAFDEYIIIKSNPIKNTLPNLNLKKEKTILFRTYETQAAYAHKVDTINIIKKLEKEFTDCNIIVLGRYYEQIKFLKRKLGNKIIVLDKVVDSKEILSLCDVFVGSGGTMTTEAVLRGIPTLSYNTEPMHDERYLIKLGMLFRATTPDQIIKITKKLLNSDKMEIQIRAKRFLESMENPHSKLLKVVNF